MLLYRKANLIVFRYIPSNLGKKTNKTWTNNKMTCHFCLNYFFKKRTLKSSTVYIPRIGRAVYAVNKSRFLSFRTTPKDTDNTPLLF